MPAHAHTKSWLEELTTPVATLGPALYPELAIMQRRLLELFFQQREYLATKPTAFLVELLHRCEEKTHHADYSVRCAAEFNRAACVLILEERGEQMPKGAK